MARDTDFEQSKSDILVVAFPPRNMQSLYSHYSIFWNLLEVIFIKVVTYTVVLTPSAGCTGVSFSIDTHYKSRRLMMLRIR